MNHSMHHEYCVIGHPIGHTLSPDIHARVFQLLRRPLSYRAVDVPPGRMDLFIAESRSGGRPGFNVTVPHKEAIIPFLDEIDDLARNVGAVNTVQVREGRLTGYNTDVFGCRIALEKAGWTERRKVALLGCGGAARAAVEAVARLGAEEVVLFDVLPEKAADLQSDFQKKHAMIISSGSVDPQSMARHFTDIDLLINATPVGMWPHTDQSPVPEASLIPAGITVLDMVYKPKETLLVKQALSRNARVAPGLMMLVAQAIAADEIWLEESLVDRFLDPVFNHIQSMVENHD